MTTFAIGLRQATIGPALNISRIVAQLRERRQIITEMHRLQSMPDYRLDDIGVARSNIPNLTGAERLPYLRAVTRILVDQPDAAALNPANFHTGK